MRNGSDAAPKDALRSAMGAKGITVSKLSEKANVSKSTISRMLATGDGFMHTWESIADALDMSLTDLVGGRVPEEVGDAEKIARVDRWLEDVANASQRWKTVKAAQDSTEKTIRYLEEIESHMRGVPSGLRERMGYAISRNKDNAGMLAEEALRLSEMESGFYAVLPHVEPPQVAEAWRMRCMEGKTWAQCSMSLHYNRTHLERLSKKAKLEAYEYIPEVYRYGG